MTALARHVEDYLAIRRALGFKLRTERRMLADFVAFMDRVGGSTVTIDTALRWATMPTGVGDAYLAQRMRAVRGFARYLHGIDPATEIPPRELLPSRRHRPTPHIYTEQEIAALMAAARTLRPPLRALTIETLIGLLACTGLRVSEAFALDRADIDAANRLLRIRDSKYGKSREVLIHDSTLAALNAYLARRDELRPSGDRLCVFASSWGARLNHNAMHTAFDQIRRIAGLTGTTSGRPPRAHDLRHTFAVNTLLRWYRNGDDVATKLPLLSTYLGHVDPVATYWYLSAAPELLSLAAERLERPGDGRGARDVAFLIATGERARRHRAARARSAVMSALAPTMQAFFTERLIGQRQASPHTIAAYRDTFRLLLSFIQQRTGINPHALDIEDLDAETVAAFLDHLERERGNGPRTRNVRLAAIRSLYHYAALRHPEHAATIARVLAIPTKRHDRAIVCYLDEPETAALLAAPDQTRWIGRRDRALMSLTIQTGLRVSELIALRCQDAHLARAPHIQATGKGRKHRITPLTANTSELLRRWTKERAGHPDQPLFPTSRGRPLSRDAVALLVSRHATTATARCPTLATKTVSPHVLRHTAAMNLLHAGVDTSVIALWLGHESTEATQIYLHADMAIKERALARTTPTGVKPGRYRPADTLLAFLEQL